MIHVIYLAAGQSKRFGSNKLLASYKGKRLYRYGLDALTASLQGRDDCTLTIVTCYEQIIQEISAEYALFPLKVVLCPDSHLGISHSIRAGILSVLPNREADYFCFAVADQPHLQPDTILKLLKTAEQSVLTACLTSDGQSGNPVLFHASLVSELLALEGDRGGKAVMRAHLENHMDVECSACELWDVDVPEKK